MGRMKIVEFEPGLAEAFRTINEDWIRRYFELEDKDREVLGDPQGQIIAKGGAVFFALDGEEPVGCVALIPMNDGGVELAKMGVLPKAQGQGAAKALINACVDRARAMQVPRIFLETNSVLGPALNLYRSTGFRDLASDCAEPSPYARCDVQMELRL